MNEKPIAIVGSKMVYDTGSEAEWRDEAARLRGVLNAIRSELGLPTDRLPAEQPQDTPPEVIAIRALSPSSARRS
jgi:hypothetical protein